ncbi:hypothetical protein FRC20_009358 [Serendipita sp. 405]|nr:hypothetical protein FRC20_009358 [Serendipita sp. 405]
MAAAYRSHPEPYRDSLRSAQSTSVYSDSSYLDGSPLDSIIRDYPVVPGASPNAFKFSPMSSGGNTKVDMNGDGRFKRAQQQPRGTDAPERLREHYQSTKNDLETEGSRFAPQVHERSGSSPLLHNQFHSPAGSISIESRDTSGQYGDRHVDHGQNDASGRGQQAATAEYTNLRQEAYSTFDSHGYHGHGIPPRVNHGVTPLNLSSLPIPQQPDHLRSKFSPITPDIDISVAPPTPKQGISQLPVGTATSNPDNLRTGEYFDYLDRSSNGTQFSDMDSARQTWMTTTSAMSSTDPFSFRHFETPQPSPNGPTAINTPGNMDTPAVIVHRPVSEAPSEYDNNYVYPGAQYSVVGTSQASGQAIVPPSPTEPVMQGRQLSKVPIANKYNFSRPIRAEINIERGGLPMGAATPSRGSEYSTISTSTDVPHTIMGFPEPPIPTSVPPSVYQSRQMGTMNEPEPPLTRKAIARMSIPKTMPNRAYMDDQFSPSSQPQDLTNSPLLQPSQLSNSPGNHNKNSSPRSLSPIPDGDRSPSPSSISHGSPHFNSPSPLPGPPRTYEVPYSYHVTITDRQYQYSTENTSSSQSHENQTRYSMGGTAVPPAPREVVVLPSSPPPVGPRPGTGLSVYSRYSFYNVGDLPESGAPTPKGWEKSPGGRISPARSDSTPTPTRGQEAADDQSTLPYLNGPGSSSHENPSDESALSAQECLLLGISHHEANRLQESAVWFERAATLHGGCGVGMLMWGLSLRHAWGVEKDERAAFWWLKRAAGCAVEDMERTRNLKSGAGADTERDRKAVQSELVLAVYEVGQCFFHGWGVEVDKKLAVSYFQVAARLGDVDAQLELGFCYANGKGCKKDLKESARWYRAATAQGASPVGLAWIYKPKYGGGGNDELKESENPIDKSGRLTLPSSTKSSSASVRTSNSKPDGPRKLKKPPPRSRTPNGRAKSPARTDISGSIGIIESP